MPFEELKARQSVMWGSGPFERVADTIRDVHEVVLTHLNDAGNRLVIESWHPGRGIEVVERE